jgi:hypothetical protein
MNYKADKKTLPSVRGMAKPNAGKVSTTSDPEPATKKDVTAVSQNFTLDDVLMNEWVTFQANGCSVWLIAGASDDTVTAVATGPALKLADGQTYDALITKNTQQIGFISTGSFTGGLQYWPSSRND